MKKTVYRTAILGILLVLLSSQGVFAQATEGPENSGKGGIKKFRKSEIVFSAGFAFPIKELKKLSQIQDNLLQINSAEKGSNYNFAYNYYFLRWLGLGFMVDVTNFKINSSSIINYYREEGYRIDGFSTTLMQTISPRLALNLNIPLFLGLSITARGTLGYAWQLSPEIIADYKRVGLETVSVTDTYERAKSGNMIGGFGLGVKFKIKGFGVFANADYAMANPFQYKKAQLITEVDNTQVGFRRLIDYTQPYNVFTLSFGILIAF